MHATPSTLKPLDVVYHSAAHLILLLVMGLELITVFFNDTFEWLSLTVRREQHVPFFECNFIFSVFQFFCPSEVK